MKNYYQGIYNELVKLSEAHQNPSIFWFGTTLITVVSSAEDMQAVLNSPHCLQKAFVYDLIADNIGIFMSKGNFFLYIVNKFFFFGLWELSKRISKLI